MLTGSESCLIKEKYIPIYSGILVLQELFCHESFWGLNPYKFFKRERGGTEII